MLPIWPAYLPKCAGHHRFVFDGGGDEFGRSRRFKGLWDVRCGWMKRGRYGSGYRGLRRDPDVF